MADLDPKIPTDKNSTSLREQFSSITPIEKIDGEISGYSHLTDDLVDSVDVGEQDLSPRKLNEHQAHLHNLQKEQSDRLHKVLEAVNEVRSLCRVLGLEFGKTVSEVHPSLREAGAEHSTDFSNPTLEGLDKAIRKLELERKIRFQNLKEIMASVIELWNFMDSPDDERLQFRRVISTVGSPEAHVTGSGVLSLEIIEQASAEVERLMKLKASRMKELVFKRRSELEDVCRKVLIEPDTSTVPEKFTATVNSGLVVPFELLAVNRKEIMEGIDGLLAAFNEEVLLEDYNNQDQNWYSAGIGTHINPKHAERARVTVNKIPAIVDNLINKIIAWENERKMSFLNDGVRLVSMLEDYKLTRQPKEEEKRRYRADADSESEHLVVPDLRENDFLLRKLLEPRRCLGASTAPSDADACC